MNRENAVLITIAIIISICPLVIQADESPLEIAILEEQGRVDIGKPFKVEINNSSGQAITIYDPRSAEGFRALSLVFTNKKTKKEMIANPIEKVPKTERRLSNTKDIANPDLRAKLLDCRSNTLSIRSKEKFRFYVFLRESIEAERPDVSQIAEWDLRVLYAPTANTEEVWSGRILSKPVQGKLYCSTLNDLKTAIKFSEPTTLKLLDSDPQWLSSLKPLGILKLGIANNRSSIVRWAIKHDASPFEMVNKSNIDSYAVCPAAKIASVDVLKVVWDELPNRRDDLYFAICEVARRDLSNPHGIDIDSQKENIEAMLEWGANPSLFSAIYTDDFASVKSMLATVQQMPIKEGRSRYSSVGSPLVWAVACGRVEIAEWLIERFNLDVNSDFGTSGPLLAYATRSAPMVDSLCKHHASFVDDHPSAGYAGSFTWEIDATAIDFAAAYGTPEVMESLLKNGAVLEYSASEMHPLAIAAYEQNWPVLKLLVTHPKFLVLDQRSRSSILVDARSQAVSSRSRPYLLTEGKRDALTTLDAHDSWLEHIQEDVRQLLDSDGSLDDPRGDAARSLMKIALDQNRVDIVTQLLDAGYEKQIDYAEFLTASCSGSLDTLQLLADRCNFDFEVNKDRLLLAAAARGDFNTTKFLLARGANPDATDQRGLNPLDVAKTHPQSVTTAEVERLILSRKP